MRTGALAFLVVLAVLASCQTSLPRVTFADGVSAREIADPHAGRAARRLTDLLASCAVDSSGWAASEKRWQQALAGPHLLAHGAEPADVRAAGRIVRPQSILLPLSADAWPDHVLVREGAQYLSFTKYATGALAALLLDEDLGLSDEARLDWLREQLIRLHSVQPDAAPPARHSALWGEHGELWTSSSRLPDFSFAGYHSGESPLPRVAIAADVRDFGALGDGAADDTEAFRRAIEATESGAILIPAGQYRISDILWIRKSGVVLRGEGPERTVLHFARELEDVRPNPSATTSGQAASGYSWSGGFVWFQGSVAAPLLTPIVSAARRGDSTFAVADATGLEAGRRIQVEVRDDAQKTLVSHLYAGDPGSTTEIRKPIVLRFVSRIAAVDGERVTLERPLRWDLRPEWSPRLLGFDSALFECGIEDLALRFPTAPYRGHFTERGRNAIAMSGVDCWVRNVRVTDCDSGVFLSGSTFCTVSGLLLDGSRTATRGDTGHHGVTLGNDCLLEDFEFRTKFIHDLTVTNFQSGNVFKNGKGRALSLDHHRRGPFENLFCNLEVGDGAQLWRSGGGADLGHHCAARGTFWGIRSTRPLAWPPRGFGPSLLNLVGVDVKSASVTEGDGRWLEAIPPVALRPADLHAAMLARRLGG